MPVKMTVMNSKRPPQLREYTRHLNRFQILSLYILALQYHYRNIIKRNKLSLSITSQATLAAFIYYQLPHHPIAIPTALGLTLVTSVFFQMSVRLLKT